MILSIVSFVINLYCIIAILIVKDLRKLDYFFVALQSVVDLLISGVFSTIFNYVYMANYVHFSCFVEEIADYVLASRIPYMYNIAPIQPKYSLQYR